MSKIVFACISPHPPLILPDVGSPKDREAVKNTIKNLEILGKKLKESGPEEIIISSPHPDWGFNVPLFFLAKNFKGKINTYLMGTKNPEFYFEQGKEISKLMEKNKKYALIASGDMSHCLLKTGPYGFQSDGPKFDKEFIESLKKKDLKDIFKLNEKYPEAGECGLRSFCFMLGILEEAKTDWEAEVLSYEGPFGVGYLTAELKL